MFKIIFSDGQKIYFEDIIELNSIQQLKILTYASKSSRVNIQNSKSGLKIQLDSTQKTSVLTQKNELLKHKSTEEILGAKIIVFTSHSVDRMIERYKGNLTEINHLVIETIKKANKMGENSEWKGYNNLTYTFHYDDQYALRKTTVVFVNRNQVLKLLQQ